MESFSRRKVLQAGAGLTAGLAITNAAYAQPVQPLLAAGDPKFNFAGLPPASACRLLSRTVDKTQAVAEIRPGFVNNTYFLIVAGKKPWISMSVSLVPVWYAKQPEFWEIQVVACQPGFGLPVVGTYSIAFSIDAYLGTKGVEVVWADSRLELPVP